MLHVCPALLHATDPSPAASASVTSPAPSTAVADPAPGPVEGFRHRRTGFVVVSRSAELQASEDALGFALVAMVGGTRPAVSPAMVATYLLEHFDIMAREAVIRRHDPEDFIVRFRRREDRDRVLASPPGGALLPLI